jgi:hypothetical protein
VSAAGIAGDYRLVWRGQDEPRLRTARLGPDGVVLEPPHTTTWAIGSLLSADNGRSLWIAGAGIGEAEKVRYRRLATNGVFLPDAELALDRADAVTGMALAAGPQGDVWLVRNVLSGGMRTLHVDRYAATACP